MQCQDVMLMLVHTCTESDTLADCARLMRDEHIGFVPITNRDGAVTGVMTDRDLVVRALADGKPAATPLGEVMTRGPLLTCRPEEDLRDLETRMGVARKGRAIVVDQRQRLVGVISLSDIASAEPSSSRTSKLLRDVSRRESVAIARP